MSRWTKRITCTYCEEPAPFWHTYHPEDECDSGREPVCAAHAKFFDPEFDPKEATD